MNQIVVTEKVTDAHWQLYLMADPEKQAVMAYLQRARKFEIDNPEGKPIAEMMLLPTRPATCEIVNLAVTPEHRHHGLAKNLISFAKDYAREFHYQLLEVGTATTSFGPLALYQQAGFRVVGVDQGFFTTHYQKQITENGIPVRDMLRLAFTAEPENHQ